MLGTTLDVAIGLVFIFLLFSLFLSTALEAVAAILKLRARALEIALKEMIGDPATPVPWPRLPAKGLFGLLPGKARTDGAAAIAGDPLRFATLFRHPLIAPGTSRPSYIPPRNFSTALLYGVRVAGSGSLVDQVSHGMTLLPPGELKEALATALVEAEGDVHRLRLGIERWFDNAMDRLSGSYKRFSQAMTFLCALLLALAFHIDAIGVGERLAIDPPLRDALVQQAADYVAAPAGPAAALPAAGAPSLVALRDQAAAMERARDTLTGTVSLAGPARSATPQTWGRYLIGILITALAGMLGGPFWFDLLQKLVSLRGAGPKPAKPPAL